MKKWIIKEKSLNCIDCNHRIEKIESLDHHFAACPNCGVKCMLLAWGDDSIQIVPSNAPEPIGSFLEWAEESLDEVQFVEILGQLEEMLKFFPEE